ncbi:hypothetical protein EVAR_43676_1 [Eumeta japonica]|uniref:Uncharacterized protein n=1 Tax=Eumeta variegata TaxID=151549 RepID=A0A4C1WWH9_EUMVA|nr:hypothetical protein EVAR_43676_1 [Eumeta japonica]
MLAQCLEATESDDRSHRCYDDGRHQTLNRYFSCNAIEHLPFTAKRVVVCVCDGHVFRRVGREVPGVTSADRDLAPEPAGARPRHIPPEAVYRFSDNSLELFNSTAVMRSFSLSDRTAAHLYRAGPSALANQGLERSNLKSDTARAQQIIMRGGSARADRSVTLSVGGHLAERLCGVYRFSNIHSQRRFPG